MGTAKPMVTKRPLPPLGCCEKTGVKSNFVPIKQRSVRTGEMISRGGHFFREMLLEKRAGQQALQRPGPAAGALLRPHLQALVSCWAVI